MATLRTGQEFAGYLLKKEIGRGGMGVVYLAEQVKLGRDVALKVMASELSRDPGYKSRFEREARLAAGLDHPHVVPLFEADEVDGWLYLAMRHVAGTDLANLLAREGRLDPKFAATVIRQISSALDAAHRQGLVHRDVKPANILLTEEDGAPHAYLTDFGIAKDSAANTQLTHTGEWVGTLDYVAPEQFQKGRVDARADVYSLGCVLFEMLAGRVPYEGTGMQKMWSHANEDPPLLADTDAQLGRAFDPVLARALAKRSDDRFPSAGDLGRAAVAAATGESITVPERTVATGAALTGARDSVVATRQMTGQSTAPVGFGDGQARPPEHPTARLRRSRQHLVRLRSAVIAVALLAVGGAAALALSRASNEAPPAETAQATGEHAPAEKRSNPAEPATRERRHAAGKGTTSRQPRPTPAPPAKPSPRPAAKPGTYAGYSPPAGGFWTELPSGKGWSTPLETEPTPGRLYRTTVNGPGGVVLIIDYTPGEPARFGGSYDSRRELSHPWFGSMTEYTFSGGRIPECQTTPCVDYIVNAGSGGPGFGVLAGGTSDTGLAQSIARHVAMALVSEDV